MGREVAHESLSEGRLEIGVVIPARDEALTIGPCLASLRPFFEAREPVVVVDAASSDDTAAVAEQLGARVMRANAGARGLAVASGYEEIALKVACVLIVHADMTVPAAARERILDSLRRAPDAVGGSLGHRIDDPRPQFRWVEAGNRFRARRWQLPYGDQAQFVRTSRVAAVGGFPRVMSLEDLELALRLRESGRWLYLDCPVSIPSRHWKGGVVLTTLRNWARMAIFLVRRRYPAESPRRA